MKQVPFESTGIEIQYNYAQMKRVLEQLSEIGQLEKEGTGNGNMKMCRAALAARDRSKIH